MDIMIRFFHLVAAMIWVGGQLFLAIALAPALRNTLSLKDRMPVSLAVARRFKRISHGALGILLLTGLWQVRYLLMSSIGSFSSTQYGRFFFLKMGLLFLSLVLSLLHDKRWGPAMARWSDAPESSEFKAAARHMIFWARVNIFVTLAIVACAAALPHNSF